MLIYNGTYKWKGWGGALRLGSGSCGLKIFNLAKNDPKGLTHLKPVIVIVTDVPESQMSVRSCAGHIATSVSKEYNINYNRMLYIEHYPEKAYGGHQEHVILERYDVVEFIWRDDKAIQPKWRTLKPPMLDMIKQMINMGDNQR